MTRQWFAAAAPEAAAAAPVAAAKPLSERQPNVLPRMPPSGPSRADDQGLHLRVAARKGPATFFSASEVRAAIRLRPGNSGDISAGPAP